MLFSHTYSLQLSKWEGSFDKAVIFLGGKPIDNGASRAIAELAGTL